MNLRSSRNYCACWMLLAISLLGAHTARAATSVQAASVVLPGVALKQVDGTLAPDADGQLALHLSIASADVDALGWKHVGVDLQGTLIRSRSDTWYCQGRLTLRGAPGGMLRKSGRFGLILDIGANTLQLDLGDGKDETVSLALPLDQTTHVQAQFIHVPLAWLQGPLSHAWSGRLKRGSIDGTMAMDFFPDGLQGAASLQLSKASFDGGSVAGEGVGLKGRLKIDVNAQRSQIGVSGTLRGGDLLLGPVYANLPAHATQLAFDLTSQGGSMRVDHLSFSDPRTLSLAGGFIFGADGSLHSMTLNRFGARFPAAYQRYGKTWLSTLGLNDLKTDGGLSGALVLGANGMRALRLQADQFDVRDGAGRFRVHGLNGELDWNRSGTRPATAMSWKGMDLYRIPLGGGTSHWRSERGVLRLTSAVTVPVLGGQLGIQQFAWQPGASEGDRVDMTSTVTGVDMSKLSHALGWPRFHGTLAGSMPGLSYVEGNIRLQGGLALNVFDGFVDVTDLSLKHPFGDTPELAADVSLHKLNLGAMTDVFDFGKITGELHGGIRDLRLVDWAPVGFDAQLLADSGGRISQRAVNNLTSVGGGGIAGGLQGAVLKLFKSFRYDRIGLHCKLEGSVCRMGGLEPKDGGYLIVDGEGLPHLTVIGHQHRVSWPTLVSRLKSAIEGGGPKVE
ncbi:YdbH domain-containing protein [Oleiagrimonas sp. MCCC 1A03011]|uniref:YdbH domain-containing protein n=1 Tax=Oleiagrimonas sp. MCCC 1A03011 TaxID=1926883 RepID=UPI000DC4AB38|nr:YdbH domain-containing protein [Oleiagrimonas sp. MCCC 1A03011]RAP57770.1 hypothetical protein BTJ49_07745 [Oleiagrimonas sp. MCCC 1A03011]